MNSKSRVLVALLAALPGLALAGNVMEMVTRDMQGQMLDRMVFYTDGDRGRMDSSGQSGNHSVIFLADEFIYLDHKTQSYMVMDEAMLEGIGNQINAAMQQMEAQLAAMPPEQRAMVEQMMKEQMGGMAADRAVPALEIRKIGKGSYKSWDCELSEMLENGRKIQEICSVDYDEVDGSGEVRASFVRMAGMLSKLYDSMPFPQQGVSNPMEMLNQMEGFPVRAVDFENGAAVSETVLESSKSQGIEGTMFALPDGYKRMDPFSP